MADVFISYRRSDRRIADQLERLLSRAKLSVWFDRDLTGGEAFVERINEELELARIVITVWSSAAAASAFVKGEMLRAFNLGKLFIIRTDDEQVPAPFDSLHILDWRNTATRRDLATSVKERIAQKGTGKAAVASELPHEFVWGKIENSVDLGDYEDFAHHFRETPQGFEASRRLRQLAKWQSLEGDSDALKEFSISAFPALAEAIRAELGLVDPETSSELTNSADEHGGGSASAVKRYLDLWVSSIAIPLLNAAKGESALNLIPLTEDIEPVMSEGLTPKMAAWLETFVRPWRDQAIAELVHLSEAMVSDDGRPGLVPPVEVDKLKLKYKRQRAELSKGFQSRNISLQQDFVEQRHSYEAIRQQEGGREARVISPWFTFALLTIIVAGSPLTISNYVAIRSLPFIMSDMMALGVLVNLSTGVLLAAYLLGKYARSFSYFHGVRSTPSSSRSGNIHLLLLFLLFLVFFGILAAIYLNYDYSLADGERQFSVQQFDVLLTIVGYLGGNVLVMLLGAVITFLCSDPNPEYQEIGRRLKRTRKLHDRRLAVELQSPVRDLDALYDARMKELNTNVERQLREEKFQSLVDSAAKIKSKDQEVVGVLKDYRNELVGAIARKATTTWMQRPESLNPEGRSVMISPDIWNVTNIELKWSL